MEKIAFIFPGQGSQYAGMGKDLYDNSPEAKNIFDQAEKILPGLNLKKICFEGPIEESTETTNSQVAILVTSIAALCALSRGRSRPSSTACAGLSLGEYSALVACGSLEFSDAVKLVRHRGELMGRSANKNPGVISSVFLI